ncbi:uncharacterized protein LOC129793747 [Lutzomyia longipalpis]|uniref:Putative secreted protein n=1 Tax=Lutzomyia longipalpis TaxID=7200 RepID=A0A1B0CAB2_LUTLO|nr:uncharacterized protein LOC129793747 [Lutzomyia longipalpis]
MSGKCFVLFVTLFLAMGALFGAEGRYLPTRSDTTNLDRLRDMIRNVLNTGDVAGGGAMDDWDDGTYARAIVAAPSMPKYREIYPKRRHIGES